MATRLSAEVKVESGLVGLIPVFGAHSETKFLYSVFIFSASRGSILDWHILSGDVPGQGLK